MLKKRFKIRVNLVQDVNKTNKLMVMMNDQSYKYDIDFKRNANIRVDSLLLQFLEVMKIQILEVIKNLHQIEEPEI